MFFLFAFISEEGLFYCIVKSLYREIRMNHVKQTLEQLVERYKTPEFIEKDPLWFPSHYRSDAQTCELVAFITALMSYGRRESIFKAMTDLLDRLDGDPRGFMESYSQSKGQKAFRGWVYRFYKPEDLQQLFQQLQRVYGHHDSLESFFMASGIDKDPFEVASPEILKEKIHSFRIRFLSMDALGQQAERVPELSYGLKFMFANPLRGGACKRFNMFLRWMVREDNVDLGLWKKALTPAQLVIPLDTHVATQGRKLGLLQRKANDWQSAESLTNVFQEYCPADPVRYDFALFGLGVSGESEEIKESLNKING